MTLQHYCKYLLALVLHLLYPRIKASLCTSHRQRDRKVGQQGCVTDWQQYSFTHNTAVTRPSFFMFCIFVSFLLPLHFNSWISHSNLHHSNSNQHPKRIILTPAQSELTPRPFSNCPGMFAGAQSNWTVTITNGWFAAARHCNVALNERKHAHQFHTVANTIMLWVIVVGHFSFKVLFCQRNLPWLCVYVCE